MNPVVGARFSTMDPLAEKYYDISPYAYGGNNPVNAVDPDGRDIYMLFYTIANEHGGDDTFEDAAMTRKFDIEHSKGFNPKEDIVVMCSVLDLAQLCKSVSSIVDKYSERYGKTAEFSIWSHSGVDGPIGSVNTSQYATCITQMSLEGWSKIDFNWNSHASAFFFGCNSGTIPDNRQCSFVTSLSNLDNFRNVDVYGQTSFAYPSKYSDARYITYQMAFGMRSFPTYFVGAKKGEGLDAFFFASPAIPMRKSRNGRSDANYYIQPGKRY